MSLSNEDNLRLNVLLTQDLRAIRVDESAMVVHALTGKGEAKVQLVPNCRDDVYLRKVRELFSTHALGSPGGYPVFLKRWTRMGQTREQNLDRLLILGEPEAVVAVAHAPGLNEELARHTWWAMPTSDIARRLLECQAVVQSPLGKELADFLLDYLPFETEALDIIENVRLVLQPNLIDEQTRTDLWSRAGRKTMFYVGFLLSMPDNLPNEASANPVLEKIQSPLADLLAQGNPYAKQLSRLLSTPGQMYLKTLDNAFAKLTNQDMTVALLKAIENYFADIQPETHTGLREVQEVETAAQQRLQEGDDNLRQLANVLDGFEQHINAMLCLSMIGETIVNPIFSQTDAIGSVMRRKLEPVTIPIRRYIQQLQT